MAMKVVVVMAAAVAIVVFGMIILLRATSTVTMVRGVVHQPLREKDVEITQSRML